MRQLSSVCRWSLSAACLVLLAGGGSRSVAQQGDAIDGSAAMPIRGVTLYRSGVGGVLRAGEVTGDATVALEVAAGDINDMLKSMTILDYGGGSVSAITYDPADPLARTLSSFDIDLSGNPSIAGLFDQLRGQRVILVTGDGDIEGTIIGTEMREIEVSGIGEGVQRQRFVNLLRNAGIRSIRVNDIREFEIADEDLAAELERALATIAQRRTEDTKSVQLSLTGSADRARDVAVFTIQQMPVWKMSYRLVLPADGEGEPMLQGYAIVENTTDADWEDVQLSLAAGRPVSFEMNLYEPLYLDRPDVRVPMAAAARPKVFQAGRMEVGEGQLGGRMLSLGESFADENRTARQNLDALIEAPVSRAQGGGGGLFHVPAEPESVATSQSIGQQFFLTLDQPVTIERQRSAMLPVVAGDIGAERVSIFNPRDDPNHPMFGVELTNTADLTLLPGPITVFDGSAYAGDAQIPHIPVGSDQLLAYAMDLEVLAERSNRTESVVDRVRILRGAFEQRTTSTITTTYAFTNRDERNDRRILIEHTPTAGYELLSPTEPAEETSDFMRFELALDAGDGRKFDVVEQRELSRRIGITDFPMRELLRLRTNGKVSQRVIEAVEEAARLRAQVADTQRRLETLEGELAEIERDQQRIRENIARVDSNSNLFIRYAQRLDQQEDRIEEISASRSELSRTLRARQEALTQYLQNLNVD